MWIKIAKFIEAEKEVELTRERLNKAIVNYGREKMTSEEILKLSREADEAIVKYQRLLNKE